MTQLKDKPPFRWKTVRVFISSTFRDMHAERDYLVKYVFPDLRQQCEQWKLHLVDIDLRWGVTASEVESGKVIEICLEQIDGSRPFFISMLGNRYGWTPKLEDIPESTTVTYDRIKGKKNCSVTHLEIFHAVLEPLQSIGFQREVAHSFFYFRDKNSLPDPSSIEEFTESEREEYRKVFLEESSSCANSLDRLKENIRTHYKDLGVAKGKADEIEWRIFNYHPEFDPILLNPEDKKLKGRFKTRSLKLFGERVKKDLERALKLEFPKRIKWFSDKRERDLLEPECDYHDSFIENRTQLFVGRAVLMQQLKDYVDSDSSNILALYGEPGSGKSALLAKFCQNHYDGFLRENHEKVRNQSSNQKNKLTFLPYFIGAGPGTTSLNNLLKWICEEIKLKYKLEDEIPLETDNLIETFKVFLKKITDKTIILIDGLNQMDEGGNAHNLSWLPQSLPSNVKIIVSTLEGTSKEALKKKTTRKIDVTPLSDDERWEIIQGVPSIFCKTLDRHHVDELIKKKETSNPLYLKVALSELIVFGSHDLLGALIASFPDNLVDMFVHVLDRLERDHQNVPGIVQRLFCLLECSRYGLTRHELGELMAEVDKDRTHLVILRQVRAYFHDRGNLVDFFHRGFSKAIRKKYLADDPNQKIQVFKCQSAVHWHGILAEYFMGKPLFHKERELEEPNIRKLIEQPWQQTAHGHMGNELTETLTDILFCHAKVTAGMLIELQADFTRALGNNPGSNNKHLLETYSSLLLSERHHLNNRSDLTFQQLFNSLQWHEGAVKDNIEKAKNKFLLSGKRFLWQYRVPKIVKSNLLMTLTGHNARVRSCSFSPDGKKIISGSDNTRHSTDLQAISSNNFDDHTLILWDSKTGQEIYSMKGVRGVKKCGFSDDGKNIFSVSVDGIVVWDSEMGEEITRFKSPAGLGDACCYSPDSKKIVSSNLKINTLTIWDWRVGREIATLKGHVQWVTDCSYSPDGRKIISSSDDETIKVWNSETGEELATLSGHTSDVKACKYSPDGNTIVSASWDGTLKVWDSESGELIATIEGEQDFLEDCSYSPDGKMIVSAGRDATLKIWDSELGQELATLVGHNGVVDVCNYSPNGKYIVSASHDKTVRIWDGETTNTTISYQEHNGRVEACTYSPDGKRVISASKNEIIKVWDSENGNEIPTFQKHVGSVTGCSYSPDSKRIAFASYSGLAILDPETGEVVSYFNKKHSGSVDSFCYSPDGRRIVSASFYSTTSQFDIRIWDSETGTEIFNLDGLSSPVNICSYSPDGKRVIAGCSDGTIKCWNSKTGELITSFRGHNKHTQTVNMCTYSPDGKRLISASDDNTLKIWDSETGQEIASLKGHTGCIKSCAYAPDGKQLVSASDDHTLKIWDSKNGKEISTLVGHNDQVWRCSYSPDGKNVISTSSDNTVKIWDIKTGDEIFCYFTETGAPHGGFSPDGKSIVIGDTSGNLYFLKLEGLEIKSPIITLQGRGTDLFCPHCGTSFMPNINICDAIDDITMNLDLTFDQKSSNCLPEKVWDDPHLLCECPHCKKPTKCNPFIVEN